MTPGKGLERLLTNPFWVLELPTDATPVEIERQGQKLLAMLTVGLDAATTYPTPFGAQTRTADAVRQAQATLRDPASRARAAFWADAPAPGPAPPRAPAWPDLRERLGWR